MSVRPQMFSISLSFNRLFFIDSDTCLAEPKVLSNFNPAQPSFLAAAQEQAKPDSFVVSPRGQILDFYYLLFSINIILVSIFTPRMLSCMLL